MIRCFLHPASAGWFFEVDNSSAVVIKYKYDAWGKMRFLDGVFSSIFSSILSGWN